MPLVGIVIGGLEALLLWAAQAAKLPASVTALLFLALPILVTGGIHLDGLIDTADARHSFGDREEKLRILKDPHVGAFGIIRLALYLMLLTAALLLVFSKPEMRAKPPYASLLIPFTLSRALTALTAVVFPGAKKEGLLQSLSGQGKRGCITAAVLEALAVTLALLLLFPLPGAAVLLLSQGILLWRYYRFAMKNFGGVTGDLSGWFLCLSELLFAWGTALFCR